MGRIDVSVIIPIYGVENCVEGSLSSLFAQTKSKGVEYILVDDCSKDKSMEVVEKFISNYPQLDIKIIKHQRNRGVAAARQSGSSLARGEYVIHYDPDDRCSENMLEELYNYAKETNADIVSCDFFREEPSGTKEVKEPISGDGFECARALLTNRMHGMVWNKLVRRSLYVDNRIEFTENINLGEDLIFCVKVFCYARRIVYLPKSYYTYIYNPSSITSCFASNKLGDIEAYIEDLERFLKHRGFYQKLEKALMHKKVIEKLSLMKHTKGERRRLYAKRYPEAQQYIMECETIPLYLRKALLYASNGSLLMFNAIMTYRKLRGAVQS